jgi:hypothetical protein
VAQLHYASRLPGIVAGQDYLAEFYYAFGADKPRNVIRASKWTVATYSSQIAGTACNRWLQTP